MYELDLIVVMRFPQRQIKSFETLTLEKLCIFPTECMFVSRMILRVNGDYFPNQD
jgi:hypothetical protein